LLTNEGAPWQRQRRLMQPPFTARAVSQFGEAMTSATAAMLPRWSAMADHVGEIDINDEMLGLTLSMIATTPQSKCARSTTRSTRGSDQRMPG
jgi:cytochrome P450